MQRATEKKLEALVIGLSIHTLTCAPNDARPLLCSGKYSKPAVSASTTGKAMTVAGMTADLLRLEGEKIGVVPDSEVDGKNYRVLSDCHLEMLLDRIPGERSGLEFDRKRHSQCTRHLKIKNTMRMMHWLR
jgi:hypothetical protein